MMYPFKVLNKKKYALCFINAFLENICLYIMPVILSIFLTVPFSLEKFKWLIILTIVIKILEIFFNVLFHLKVQLFHHLLYLIVFLNNQDLIDKYIYNI